VSDIQNSTKTLFGCDFPTQQLQRQLCPRYPRRKILNSLIKSMLQIFADVGVVNHLAKRGELRP
jgi:hypothetical protein